MTDTTVADTTTSSDEQTAGATLAEVKNVTSLEDALKEIGRLGAINKDIIASRDRANKKAAEISQQATEKLSKSEALFNRVKVETAKNHARQALVEAGVIDPEIGLKLLDISTVAVDDELKFDTAQIKTLVHDLQKSAPMVFKTVTTTTVARPIEGGEKPKLLAEALKAAKTQKEINEAYLKYK